MEGSVRQKIPGGKLVEVKVACEDGRITNIKIIGDFFPYPADIVYVIEKRLTGTDANSSAEELERIINGVLKEGDAEIIGASSGDLARLIKSAVSG